MNKNKNREARKFAVAGPGYDAISPTNWAIQYFTVLENPADPKMLENVQCGTSWQTPVEESQYRLLGLWTKSRHSRELFFEKHLFCITGFW